MVLRSRRITIRDTGARWRFSGSTRGCPNPKFNDLIERLREANGECVDSRAFCRSYAGPADVLRAGEPLSPVESTSTRGDSSAARCVERQANSSLRRSSALSDSHRPRHRQSQVATARTGEADGRPAAQTAASKCHACRESPPNVVEARHDGRKRKRVERREASRPCLVRSVVLLRLS